MTDKLLDIVTPLNEAILALAEKNAAVEQELLETRHTVTQQVELRAALEQRAERLEVAAQAILDGAYGSRRRDWLCPHGIKPSYPTHAWWCDECFGDLEAALASQEEALE